MKTKITIGDNNYYYTRFYQIKKNGKKREINSPCNALKQRQTELKNILNQAIDPILPEYVVGFRKDFNLKKNGDQHLGKRWVINIDIKDFFPSIKKQILKDELIVFKDLLVKNGYTFEDFIEFVILNRALPQGSPTSPLLSNYIGYRLIDSKVYPYLLKMFGSNFSYTRYADDITISLSALESKKSVCEEVVKPVINIIEGSGLFSVNKKKLAIMGQAEKQLVTGLNVNNPANGVATLGKKERLKYRAIVHKIKNKEIEFNDVLRGKFAYIKSVDPEYFEKLKGELNEYY